MRLPAPTSLADLRADGALLQSDVDVTWEAWLGPVEGVEVTGGTARLHRTTGALDLPVEEIARVRDGHWEWSVEHELEIPELHAPQPASDELLAAARTLHSNRPVLTVPVRDGRRVFVVDAPYHPGPVPAALTVGLATLPADVDVRRSLLAFAAARGLQVREGADHWDFSDGTSVHLRDGRAHRVSTPEQTLSLADVRADAHYFATEHQLLLDGRFPSPAVRLDIPAGQALLDDTVQARAVVLATVTGDTWTWGWADPLLPPSPVAELRRFGVDHGIVDLVRPHLPGAEARALGLVDVAKPVLGMWTHVAVPLTPDTTGIVLLDAPELRLPGAGSPLTPAAVEATLGVAVPEGVVEGRARTAYAAQRGVTL